MTTGETLRHAAYLLRVSGHCKGTPLSEDGSLCLRGAIMQASGLLASRGFFTGIESDEFYLLICEVVRPPVNDYNRFTTRPEMHDLVAWNNHPDRTAEEVIAALVKAADLWESRQAVPAPEPEYEYA